MLFNEPKLLKLTHAKRRSRRPRRFSALQRAEIAEIHLLDFVNDNEIVGFSALQRAEIAEIGYAWANTYEVQGFSALQRAEIAEIQNSRFFLI